MVRAGLDEFAHRGDGLGSERRGHFVGILARNILKCLHIHRFEDAVSASSDPVHMRPETAAFFTAMLLSCIASATTSPSIR